MTENPAVRPRIIFVTQLVDPDDPVLGFVVSWIKALAARSDRLWVIANEVRSVPDDLGAEVISLGKEAGRGKAARGLRYETSIARLVRSESIDALVAHMCPVYLNLAAPIAKIGRVRTILWFIHPVASKGLRIADRLVDVAASSLQGAYPAPGEVVYIGHGIDVQRFAYRSPPARTGPLRLLMLGRSSPVKGIPTVLSAVANAVKDGADVHLRIVGPATTPAERTHRVELAAMVSDLGLEDVVELEDGVPPESVPSLIASSHAVISATTRGSGDKAVLEAMAVGRPVLLSNDVFKPLLEDLPVDLDFVEGDAAALAGRIVDLSGAPASDLEAAGKTLRQRVETGHSLEHWADRIVALGSGG